MEITIGRNPFAIVLDRDGGEISVRHEIAGRIRFSAEPLEDRPVSLARLDDYGLRKTPYPLDEGEGGVEGARDFEDLRIGKDP